MAVVSVANFFPPENFGLQLGADKTAQIPLTALFTTNVVPANGSLSASILTYDYGAVAAGMMASASLTLTIQPYLDEGFLVPAQAAATVTGASGAVQTAASPIFRSVVVTVSNTTASPIALTNLFVVARSTI